MTSLEDLPDLALEVVVGFLDYGSRRACRMVSRRLKGQVEEIGLSIKIDSRSAESTNLSRNVAITEARILHLDTSEFDLGSNETRYWKALIISFPIDLSWLGNRICTHCLNLRILVLNEAALVAEEFTLPSEPMQCFQRLSELHIILNRRNSDNAIGEIETAEPEHDQDVDLEVVVDPEPDEPFNAALLELGPKIDVKTEEFEPNEISLDAIEEDLGSDEDGHELNPEPDEDNAGFGQVFIEFENEHDEDHLDYGFQYLEPSHATLFTRLQRNIAFVLKITRSVALKVLLVTAQCIEETAGRADCWEYQPLYEFLHYHRFSLDSVILPDLVFGDPPEEIDETLRPPVKIRRIRLATVGFRRHVLSKFWTNLLLNQDSLEYLSIGIKQLADDPTFPWLAAVVSNNATTLTEINLTLEFRYWTDTSGFDGALDMRLFLVLESLKNLEISGAGILKILNLNDLSLKSLKELRIWSSQIGKDFDGIKFLKSESFNVTLLDLDMVSKAGSFKDSAYAFEFIKLALRCRTLEGFSLVLLPRDPEHSVESYTVNVSYFEAWLIQLLDAGGFPQLDRFETEASFDMASNEELPANDDGQSAGSSVDFESGPYNYMDMMEYERQEEDQRDPPFYLPRNIESFSVWRNRATKSYRILPTATKSDTKNRNYSLGFNLKLMFEDGDAQPRSVVALKNCGVPAEDVHHCQIPHVLHNDGACFRFCPKPAVLQA